MIDIRRLDADDAEAWQRLRLSALEDHPDAFLSSVAEERSLPMEEVARRMSRPDEVAFLVGAFDGDELVGTAGCFRSPKAKSRHTATVWGMYVAPGARGRGLGRALLDAVVARARAVEGLERLTLSVNDHNAGVRRLYEEAGFVCWGLEPDAFRVGGAPVVEAHLCLTL